MEQPPPPMAGRAALSRASAGGRGRASFCCAHGPLQGGGGGQNAVLTLPCFLAEPRVAGCPPSCQAAPPSFPFSRIKALHHLQLGRRMPHSWLESTTPGPPLLPRTPGLMSVISLPGRTSQLLSSPDSGLLCTPAPCSQCPVHTQRHAHALTVPLSPGGSVRKASYKAAK